MNCRVAVAPDKFAKGLDVDSPEVPKAYEVLELGDALARVYDTDAHLVMYANGCDMQPRVNKGGLQFYSGALEVSAFFADVDNPNHAPWTDELRAEAREQEAELVILSTCGVYDTNGGRRFVQPLAKPIPVAEVEPYLARWLDELSAAGVDVDFKCLDWTRHYRLPNVLRDGKHCRPYINLERMAPVELAPLPPSLPKVVPESRKCSSRAFQRYEDARDQFNRENSLEATRQNRPCPAEGCPGRHCYKLLPGSESKASCHDSGHPDGCGTQTKNGSYVFDALDLAAFNAHRTQREHLVAEGYYQPRQDPPPPSDEDSPIPDCRSRNPGEDDVAPQERKDDPGPAGYLGSKAPKVSSEVEAVLEELHKRHGGGKTTRELVFESALAIVEEDTPRTLWLVPGMLPEGAVAAVAGEPKSTKTWCAIEMAMAVATATPAFGEFEVREKRQVALFLAEDGRRSIKNRLRSLASSRDMEARDAVQNMAVIMRQSINLLDELDVASIILACAKLPAVPSLLVLDPLRDLHTGEENDSGAMARVMWALRAIRDITGATVLFVHHASKSTKDTSSRRPGQKMRGSSAIHGAVDAGIYLSDSKGNGSNQWSNRVDVEVKSARGAGFFRLELEVADDENDEAIAAEWRKEEADEAMQKSADDATRLVEAFLKGATGAYTAKAIRKEIGRGMCAVQAALLKLEGEGKAKKAFQGRKMVGWIGSEPIGTRLELVPIPGAENGSELSELSPVGGVL